MFILTPPGVIVRTEFSQVGDKLCRKGNIHVTKQVYNELLVQLFKYR